MKLIWVLLLLTATVALARADEEDQEFLDVEDTELDEMETITDDEQGDDELEDPRRGRRKLGCHRRRKPRPHVCKFATLGCLKAVKKMRIANEGKCKMALGCIARGIRCGFCMHKRHRPRPSGRPRPTRPRPSKPSGQQSDEEEEESDDEIEDPRRRHRGCRRRMRRRCRKARLARRANLMRCGRLGKACAKKASTSCGKLRCVKLFVSCVKGRKPRGRKHRHDEILEDVEDEELAEMPEEFSVAEGIEEDEEQMDPGRGKSKIKKVCKIVGISCFLRSRAPYRVSKRICKRRAMKCGKCLGGWKKPFRKPHKGKH